MLRWENDWNSMIRWLVYDSAFSGISTQEEKSKHNFSTRHWQQICKPDKTTLIFDVHGINEQDIKVVKTTEDGVSYIKIEGSTKNEALDCDMAVKVRWAIPYKQFKKPTKKIENGLLYIFIEPELPKEDIEEI